MENFIVSARKYRPATFDTVVGQFSLTTTLKNAIATGKLAHAYLFCGPRGVGKTTCARIFAKTINCLSPTPAGEACNECESCKAFNEQRSYNIFELDAASNNSVDDIRQLIEQVRIPPQIGKYKVYIIDEVHMLSTSAFNAFLKTLEEPPSHAVFILATTEKHKVIPTILSRCQIYDFNRISLRDTIDHLKYVAQREGVVAEPEALSIIAQKADGGMRDALSIFDQVVSFAGGQPITYKRVIDDLDVLDYEYYFNLTDYLLASDVKNSLLLLNEILRKGFDGGNFITGLTNHFRNLLVSQDEATLPLLEVGDELRQRYGQQARKCKPRFLFRAMKLCNNCELNYRVSKNKRLLVELTLIECAQLSDADSDSLPDGRSPRQHLKTIPAMHQPKADAMASQSDTAQPAQSVAKVAPVLQTNTPTPASGPATLATHPANTGPAAHVSAQPAPTAKLSTASDKVLFALGIAKTTHEASKDTSPTRQRIQERQPFDSEDLNREWLRYALSLPTAQRANAEHMKNYKPRLLDDSNFEVLVENDLVKHYLSDIMPHIEESLRTMLHNGHIHMHIRVADTHQLTRPLTSKERYDDMCRRNPALKDLKEMLNLTIQ